MTSSVKHNRMQIGLLLFYTLVSAIIWYFVF